MSAQRDLGRRLAEHYRLEASDRAPDWLLESTLAIIDTTPQRRGLLRLPWRFPIMNTFAKLATAAVAVIVGALALTTLLSAPLPGSGGPGVSPALSPSPSPSLAPSPSPSPTAIGSLTLTASGCQWVGETSALPAGPIQIEVTNATPDDAAFPLFVIDQGHTYAELASYLQTLDTQAKQDPQATISINPDMATGAGIIGLLTSGKTASLTADIPSGSVVGIACLHADVAAGVTYDVFAVGPLDFK